MASVNKVTVLGALGRDPELKYMPNGDAVCNISVATSEKYKDKASGEQRENTEWHRITFFGKLAEVVAQYMKKGSSIYVEGKLKTRKYTDKDGIERYVTEINAYEMQMLGGKAEGGTAPAPRPAAAAAPAARSGAGYQSSPQDSRRSASPAADDDIPFN